MWIIGHNYLYFLISSKNSIKKHHKILYFQNKFKIWNTKKAIFKYLNLFYNIQKTMIHDLILQLNYVNWILLKMFWTFEKFTKTFVEIIEKKKIGKIFDYAK